MLKHSEIRHISPLIYNGDSRGFSSGLTYDGISFCNPNPQFRAHQSIVTPVLLYINISYPLVFRYEIS